MKLLDIALSSFDASANATTGPINSACLLLMSVQVLNPGSAVGVVKVQVSNDPPQTVGQPFTPTNWTDAGVSVSVTGTGSFLIPKFEIAYGSIRFVYTSTSGAGNITLQVKAMGL